MRMGPWRGERLIEASWLALVAGLPVCFSPWGRNLFELPKAALLWALAAVAGAAWLWGRPRPAAPRRLWPLALVAYLAALGLAVVFSSNPTISALGSADRMDGLLSQLACLVLFLVVARHLRRPAQARRLMGVLVWASAPVVVYGLIQAAGLDPLPWQTEGSPAISTLGRSNFLGAYLVLVLPVTLVLAWQCRTRARRIALSLLLLAQLGSLVATDAQAAWLGTAAACGVLLAVAAWFRGQRRLAMGVLALGGAGLLAIVVALLLLPGLTGSLGSRGTIWRATMALIAHRPLLGHGPETFAQAFTAVFPAELVYTQGRAVIVDRAHNLVLDTLATTGLAGLVTCGLLIGACLASGAGALLRATDAGRRATLAAFLAAIVGHLAETQFSFEVLTTAAISWLLLGTLVSPWARHPAGEASPAAGETGDDASKRGAAPASPGRWPRAVRLLAGLVLLASVLPASLLVLAADTAAGGASRSSTPAELQESIDAMETAVLLWPRQPSYYQYLSWLCFQAAQRSADPVPGYRAAEAALDAARQLAPDDYRIWAGYGELYAAWAQAGEPARFALAEEAYRQAVALFPNSAMLQTGWGLLYLAQDRPAEAAEHLHQAVHLDHTDYWAFWHLGNTLLALDDLAGAEEAFTNALRWQPDMGPAFYGLGRTYRLQGRTGLALFAFQQALTLGTVDPDIYLELARCHRDLDQLDLACQAAEQGLSLAPQDPGLVAFAKACACQ
jgi:tetratricopeptide (TPR) repeat protein/O-antigen ligase